VKPLVRDARGAIYVEFLIAFMPILTMFLGIVQIADLHQARLIVSHAAMVGARAAVVVIPDDGQFYENSQPGTVDGKRKQAIVKAVSIPLRASRSITELRVTFPTTAGGSDDKTTYGRDDLVRVKVEARYQCRVPLVNRMVCPDKSSTRTMTAEAALPNNGADYVYP
jgi:hypothetical protein